MLRLPIVNEIEGELRAQRRRDAETQIFLGLDWNTEVFAKARITMQTADDQDVDKQRLALPSVRSIMANAVWRAREESRCYWSTTTK